MQTFIDSGHQQLVFTIEVHHIIFHDGQNHRVKYLLIATDEAKKCKHPSNNKKSKVPKFNIEVAQAVQDTIPTDVPLPNFGYVEAFLATN